MVAYSGEGDDHGAHVMQQFIPHERQYLHVPQAVFIAHPEGAEAGQVADSITRHMSKVLIEIGVGLGIVAEKMGELELKEGDQCLQGLVDVVGGYIPPEDWPRCVIGDVGMSTCPVKRDECLIEGGDGFLTQQELTKKYSEILCQDWMDAYPVPELLTWKVYGETIKNSGPKGKRPENKKVESATEALGDELEEKHIPGEWTEE